MTAEEAERLAARTLELVDLPSESRHEEAILDVLAAAVPPSAFRLVDANDAVRYLLPADRRAGSPLVVLAGHADTVPANGNLPGSRHGSAVFGRGAVDMKGALAVIIELARSELARGPAGDLDVGILFFGREELPTDESALSPLFARCPETRDIDLAIVMEPTDNRLEVGCLGNLNASVTIRGRAAHSARPWLGHNAIHAAIAALAPVADRPVRDVQIDGLTYREVVSVTRVQGGFAGNVVPDAVTAWVNLRYAPNRSPDEAEAELRALVGEDAEVEVIGNSPPGPVVVHNPLVARLRDAGELELGPKQAWTPVAEFAAVGVDAVNFGPGDPGYAHRDDERIEASSLVRSYEVLRRFVVGGKAD